MIQLTVNGEQHRLEVDPTTPLLWVLRDHLGMNGTKFGCGMAQCGACTVHMNGNPIRSCSMPVAGVAGAEITTIEGCADQGGRVVQEAWLEKDVPQCGYCQSGQIMSALALLRSTPDPSDAQIDAAMSGNICRCGTYQRVREAIHLAASRMEVKP